MDPGELLRGVAATLDRLGIAHFVTGSTATITYGEPRFTNDIDIAVSLDTVQAATLCLAFPAPDFYVATESAQRAVRDHSSFNVIHPASGLKVDFMVTDDSPFNASRFERATRLELADGSSVSFATPEDVILKKLEYYREGGSEKHIRDIVGVLRVSSAEIDRDYIVGWVATLRLDDEWELALRTASLRPEGVGVSVPSIERSDRGRGLASSSPEADALCGTMGPDASPSRRKPGHRSPT